VFVLTAGVPNFRGPAALFAQLEWEIPMAKAAQPKPSSRKIVTALDDQIDDSFPASDPPSLTDPSRKVVQKDPVPAEAEDPSTEAGQKGPASTTSRRE
jgi:hypothetical protein